MRADDLDLVVGKRSWPETERTFLDMGFDRAFPPGTRTRQVQVAIVDDTIDEPDETVAITDFEFTPATIEIEPGDTVTWRNDGPTDHTATSEDGVWDTGILAKGESGSHTFEEPGTFSYICTPHPFMKGKVVVADAAASDGGSDTSGGSSSPTFDDGSGTVVDSTSSGTDDSGSLASTGFDSALVALAGLLLLAGGVLLRRRLAASHG